MAETLEQTNKYIPIGTDQVPPLVHSNGNITQTRKPQNSIDLRWNPEDTYVVGTEPLPNYPIMQKFMTGGLTEDQMNGFAVTYTQLRGIGIRPDVLTHMVTGNREMNIRLASMNEVALAQLNEKEDSEILAKMYEHINLGYREIGKEIKNWFGELNHANLKIENKPYVSSALIFEEFVDGINDEELRSAIDSVKAESKKLITLMISLNTDENGRVSGVSERRLLGELDHLESVSQIAERIARESRYTNSEIFYSAVGGYLHDFAKYFPMYTHEGEVRSRTVSEGNEETILKNDSLISHELRAAYLCGDLRLNSMDELFDKAIQSPHFNKEKVEGEILAELGFKSTKINGKMIKTVDIPDNTVQDCLVFKSHRDYMREGVMKKMAVAMASHGTDEYPHWTARLSQQPFYRFDDTNMQDKLRRLQKAICGADLIAGMSTVEKYFSEFLGSDNLVDNLWSIISGTTTLNLIRLVELLGIKTETLKGAMIQYYQDLGANEIPEYTALQIAFEQISKISAMYNYVVTGVKDENSQVYALNQEMKGKKAVPAPTQDKQIGLQHVSVKFAEILKEKGEYTDDEMKLGMFTYFKVFPQILIGRVQFLKSKLSRDEQRYIAEILFDGPEEDQNSDLRKLNKLRELEIVNQTRRPKLAKIGYSGFSIKSLMEFVGIWENTTEDEAVAEIQWQRFIRTVNRLSGADRSLACATMVAAEHLRGPVYDEAQTLARIIESSEQSLDEEI